MTEELVEKVQALVEKHADGIYSACEYGVKCPDTLARAVIPVVLEEAAKVADAEAGRLREEADQIPGVSSRTEQRVAEFIACAIRNLGSI